MAFFCGLDLPPPFRFHTVVFGLGTGIHRVIEQQKL